MVLVDDNREWLVLKLICGNKLYKGFTISRKKTKI